ncbi:uncharacterized membrane protein [Rhizobium subbaraonis]|uniref:Uncharacterized membrane protein n=1 Tax=Rhizobium subbaraonis TaxID=908946 RepID=A0A285UAK7_9HYPH|nr:DUF599 family protein [Rhizobium subbaraonis]SOC38930.1 uncharacterized membrane protein [Rhizobium subbaraonis]
MSIIDPIAFVVFILLWLGYAWITDKRRFLNRVSLTRAMNAQRAAWIRNAMRRDLRMIDTQIMSGLQNGTAFFASTSILALGGCFALLGATEKVFMIFGDLPLVFQAGRAGFELKVGGLAGIFGYAFFKFGWSYRLFNYCTILLGAVPMAGDVHKDPAAADLAADKVIRMNILAAKHFNAGLRAIFLSIGYLGWFVSPYLFMLTTCFITIVLIRRQFYSEARLTVLETTE